jgi:hypothetical protein
MSDADTILESMRKHGKDVITVKWADMYKLLNKERIKDAYLEKLRDNLKAQSILMTWGNSVFVFAKDFNFAPIDVAK